MIEGAAPELLPATPVVILVQPQLGENVGTAARAMLNFGLTELRLVQPQCGWPNLKAVQACSGATEVLNRLTVFPSVAAATADLRFVLATSARGRDIGKPVMTAAAGARSVQAALAAGQRAGLLFGPERTGLVNDDLLLADAVVTVPLNPAFSSLNLAQAVLLIGYEWFKLAGPAATAAPAATALDPYQQPATKGDLSGLADHLVAELDAVDFFKAADRRISLVQAIRLLLQRAELRQSDVHLLRGIVKALAGRPPARRRTGTGG
jgi:tRNA/rRNA methyltransferase